MTFIIRGQSLHIDIRGELEKFDWTRPTWSNDKLIAASPFRYDKSPSFFVRLEDYGDYPAGTWSDSGSYDDEWSSGNIVKLLAFLRHETYEEVEEYLLASYGFTTDSTDIKLKPIRLKVQWVRQPLKDGLLADYRQDYSYLESRGISAEIQRQAGVLYDAKSQAVVIPWRLPNGELANVKYRKTRGKVFWYERGAVPIRELVYGLELATAQTVICEAEIDAMSWRQAGYSAIATGGASFNEWKADEIKRSAVEELIIATDNDKAGEKLRAEIEKSMRGRVRLRNAYIDARESNGGSLKDANEALVKYGEESLRESVRLSESVRELYVKLRSSSLGK
ncbi:toprim domain-containing protein [Cytobacillus purgationiresistens]|uniref:DNA primase n=1 Tax=Cytobacillus purgationiresistens TaxID=863449 RepID=A0ABU0AHP4_9BACI|nr:toprim domain-containing protein [Cytobacillus purgationiresistens]MDQ0270781.1 DNA primase [Cytobacillus purgationiresistens]